MGKVYLSDCGFEPFEMKLHVQAKLWNIIKFMINFVKFYFINKNQKKWIFLYFLFYFIFPINYFL